MLAELTDILGAGGTGALMLVASLSFLAWMPAIAAVVVGKHSTVPKLLLLLMLAFFPPSSLAVMAFTVKNADSSDGPGTKLRRSKSRSERCRDRQSRSARSSWKVREQALVEA